MNFPADLKYTNDHEWIRVEGNIGTIGVTEHAQGELGDVVYLDISDSVIDTIQLLFNSDIRGMINYIQLNQNLTIHEWNINSKNI